MLRRCHIGLDSSGCEVLGSKVMLEALSNPCTSFAGRGFSETSWSRLAAEILGFDTLARFTKADEGKRVGVPRFGCQFSLLSSLSLRLWCEEVVEGEGEGLTKRTVGCSGTWFVSSSFCCDFDL